MSINYFFTKVFLFPNLFFFHKYLIESKDFIIFTFKSYIFLVDDSFAIKFLFSQSLTFLHDRHETSNNYSIK